MCIHKITRFAFKEIFDNQVSIIYICAVDKNGFATFVTRQAGLVLDIEERGLRGRRYKVPRHVSDGLRSDPRFRSAMSALAASCTGE